MRIKTTICCGLALLLTACGYQLTGGKLNALPPNINTMAIPVFKNQSEEPNLEKQVTEAVIQKFQGIGKPQLVSESDNPDAILLGTVIRYSPSGALSFGANQNVQEFRTEIVGDIIIKETATGKILWQKKNHYAKREYSLSTQLGTSKINELEAKQLTAFEFARDIASLLEGF